MHDNPNSAPALRARFDHHAASEASAKAERARLIADRSEVGGLLSEVDLDEIDAEVARLNAVIERAASRVALIGPELARADARDAEIEERRNASTAAEQARASAAAVAAAYGSDKGAVAGLQLRAAAILPKPVNRAMFDEGPVPRATYADAEKWHRERDDRLRAERAARLASNMGQPARTASLRAFQ